LVGDAFRTFFSQVMRFHFNIAQLTGKELLVGLLIKGV
jgi:hypothetical protein